MKSVSDVFSRLGYCLTFSAFIDVGLKLLGRPRGCCCYRTSTGEDRLVLQKPSWKNVMKSFPGRLVDRRQIALKIVAFVDDQFHGFLRSMIHWEYLISELTRQWTGPGIHGQCTEMFMISKYFENSWLVYKCV